MKRAAALLLAAVTLCGCKAEPSDVTQSVTSEAERETSSAEETVEKTLPESTPSSSHTEKTEPPVAETSEVIPVETSEIIPVLFEETDEPTVIPPILDNAEYFSDTSFFEGEIEEGRMRGKLYFGLTVPFGLELNAAAQAVLDTDSSVDKPTVYASWTAEALSDEQLKLLNGGAFSEDKLIFDVSRELTNDGEDFCFMVERSFEDSALTRYERTLVSGLYPLERGYFQWIYYCYDEGSEREFISDAENSLRSMIFVPTYYGEPTEETVVTEETDETAEPQSNLGFTVKLPEGTTLKEENMVSEIPNKGLEVAVRAVAEGSINITVNEISGDGAWDYALAGAEEARMELDIEGVPADKTEELENTGDRIIILKKTPLVEGYLYTVSGFYKQSDDRYTLLYAFVSGKDAESFEPALAELARSFEFE